MHPGLLCGVRSSRLARTGGRMVTEGKQVSDTYENVFRFTLARIRSPDYRS